MCCFRRTINRRGAGVKFSVLPWWWRQRPPWQEQWRERGLIDSQKGAGYTTTLAAHWPDPSHVGSFGMQMKRVAGPRPLLRLRGSDAAAAAAREPPDTDGCGRAGETVRQRGQREERAPRGPRTNGEATEELTARLRQWEPGEGSRREARCVCVCVSERVRERSGGTS